MVEVGYEPDDLMVMETVEDCGDTKGLQGEFGGEGYHERLRSRCCGCRSYRQRVLVSEVVPCLSAHSQDTLESFSSEAGVLAKSLNRPVLDLVAKPAESAGSLELSVLFEQGFCGGIRGIRSVCDGFVDGQEVAEGEILGLHADGLRHRVDIRYLSDIGYIGSANYGGKPPRHGLSAGNQSFRS